jgi:thymidylate kinase
MKVIIVEGMDNTGKSTMIDRLIKYLTRKDGIDADKQIYVKHLVKPDGENDIERATNIDITNFNLATFLINAHKENKYKYIILDRAWYSEYVYGQLYRNRQEHEIRKRVQNIEEYLNNYFFKHIDTVSFHLLIFLATDPNFYIKHEDGQSLSIGNEQRDLIIKEMSLFTNIAYMANVENKGIILVNNGSEFLTEDTIFKKIKNIIY